MIFRENERAKEQRHGTKFLWALGEVASQVTGRRREESLANQSYLVMQMKVSQVMAHLPWEKMEGYLSCS